MTTGEAHGVPVRSARELAPWLGLALAVVALDQASKAVVALALAPGERVDVLPVLAWVHVHNPGAAFSFLSSAGGWQRWLFVVLAVAISAWIVAELRRLPAGERLMGWAFALVLGGALGNLVDRLLLGHVVDFVLAHWGERYFPAFNVADAAISVGAALWILRALTGVGGRGESRGD